MQDYNSTPPILSSLTVPLLIAPTHYVLIRQSALLVGTLGRFNSASSLVGVGEASSSAPVAVRGSFSGPLVGALRAVGSTDEEKAIFLVNESERMENYSRMCKGRAVSCYLGLAALSARAPSKSAFAAALGTTPVTLRNYRRGARRMAILAKEVSPAIWNVEMLCDAWTALCKISEEEFDSKLAVVRVCLDAQELEANANMSAETRSQIVAYADELCLLVD
ncbi:hypothetical protein [Absidia glauca]|uniref:Uncharacterized protein n=1 Tax=Absidia glauca TaxID=4829 RepID=A0A168L308_ABSGL|nr:hypothetical protein [Absidia glauca]